MRLTPPPPACSTSVASRVGPNGWGNKADAEGSVDHYTNALGEVRAPRLMVHMFYSSFV